jgi:aquaporin Z
MKRSREQEETRATDQSHEEMLPSQSSPHLFQRLLAEVVGTFALTVVGAGGIMINELFKRDIDSPAHFVSSGLIVMAMIYTLGGTSGAHFNPVITLAFTLRRDFPWSRVLLYWAAQLFGALIAAGLLRLLLGDIAHLGAPLPHQGLVVSFSIEVLLTFLLTTVVLGVASKAELVGNNVALAVGGTIILCGLFAGQISGACMNPARALGPYLISGQVGALWLYVLAPTIGAVVAVGVAWLLRGETTKVAKRAAQGEGN